ncbi:DUF7482 domain-containing protein [Agaribacter marinus]|uniref:DUF7482 domain-containing protein n=1 Tax=Agaribacter marinus TaxID=1431249 RepID=A0AA37SWS3_9ALTE|nr:hypothetical protein [Agaribacter marinus]GLR71007.1 hypothetical protein GCM10007852_19150 [Agaribacter marinus]
MTIKYKKLLTATFVSMILTACSGDDGATGPQGPQGEQGPAGPQGPVAEVPPESDITVAGGRLAQDFADRTAAITNAFELVAGSPAEFEADEDDVAPGPPSVGADIPVTYFGPAPSDSNPRLIGPVQLLKSGTVDTSGEMATTTIPLYEGRLASGGPKDGQRFWYIVTDTSDRDNAAALGLNFSEKLAFTDVAAPGDTFAPSAVRRGFYDEDGVLVTTGGAVDFSSVRSIESSSTDTSGTNNLISALTITPGAIGTDVGDADGFYSPLVRISNARDHIYNAPMISFNTDEDDLSPYCDGISEDEEEAARAILHDSVVSICPGEDGEPGTVTLELAVGFSFGRPVLYLSTDASVDLPAALEGAVFAPALANIPVGRDDSLFSGIERIFGFTNGATNDPDGMVHPQRQGFNSAILGEGGPLQVLGGIPTVATDYSPLWDLNLGEWTQEAIDNGYRARMTEEFAILGMVERGFLTGPGGSPYGSNGIIINCPIVQRLL